MKVYFSCLFLFITYFSWAQLGGFEPVQIADFETVALNEEDVDAIVLNRFEFVFFSGESEYFTNNKTVKERILIKNEAGLAYATEKIQLYIAGDTDETVEDITGVTYNLVDGKIVTTELQESEIFVEEQNEYWQSTTLTMPSVTEGSIIEFSYKVVSPYAYINDINIQYNIPIKRFSAVIQVNRGLIYNVGFNPSSRYRLGFDKETIESGIKDVNSFDPSTLESENLYAAQVNEVLTIKDQLISLILENVPSLEDEPMSGNINEYRAKLLIELAATKYPNGSYKYLSTDWNAVAKSISKNDDFGKQLSSTRFFRKDLESYMQEVANGADKAYQVLKFLQSRVQWNGKYGKFTDEGVKDAYDKGSGNVAEVNLLLTSMLTEVGMEAYPVLVSSQNKGTPLFPTQDGFDYVLTQVIIDGNSYLMDATAPYSYLNIIPNRAAHWKGRVIKDKESSEWIDLEDRAMSKDIVMIAATIDDDFNSVFETKRRLTNYTAFSARNKYDDATEIEIKEYLESKTSGLTVTEFTMENMDEVNKPMNITYTGIYKNGINKIGDKLYITPLLYDSNDENPFKLEKRTLPLDLSFPVETKTIVNLSIPEGYEVESLPESVKFSFDEGVGSYTYFVKQQGNIISTVATFTISALKIQPESYEPFRNFYISIVDKDAEKIILKKVE
jgi:hypothetical protein